MRPPRTIDTDTRAFELVLLGLFAVAVVLVAVGAHGMACRLLVDCGGCVNKT